LADFNIERGIDFLEKGPWNHLNPCNQALGRDSTGEQIDGEQIRQGGSPVARGKWGKMTRDSRRSRGWPVSGKGGAEVA
jgi:hypothetical protein